MRTAILAPQPPSGFPGGVEIFTEQLAAAVGGSSVFAPSSDSANAASPLARLGLDQAARALAPARALRKAQQKQPYDLIISNGLCGWPLTLEPLGSPVVQVYHFTLAGFAKKAVRRRSDRFTTGRVGGFFDRLAGAGKTVVCVSDSVRREVSTMYGHRSSVLSNGVDVSLFRRGNQSDARERLALPRDARIVLFVGRPEYAKGFDVIQELARIMRDVLFLSVSAPVPGPDNLRFFANVPHDRMPLLYTTADVFLLPSRYEGFNLSLLEALACELPAVTSRAAYPFPGTSPLLGTVVEPLTPQSLAAAVRRAQDLGPQRDVREHIVKEYSLDAFQRNWRNLAREVLDGEPKE